MVRFSCVESTQEITQIQVVQNKRKFLFKTYEVLYFTEIDSVFLAAEFSCTSRIYYTYNAPATISSTTLGSSRVEVSPSLSASPSATFRKIRLMIFPERVLGNPVTN
jgi:hypothetical protein